MELMDVTKSQTIGFFTFIVYQTTHQMLYSKSRIPSKRDCQKKTSNEEIFNTAKYEYEDAPKKSGFKVDFKYTKNQRQKPKNRSRNNIWFNPPFNKAVSRNIAKILLWLINRHFPKSHRLHKVFNRNTVKNFLCFYEELVIVTYPRQHELLNKRSELFCKYRHENKYLLKNFRANDKG